MKVILLVNTLIEGLIGILLILSPSIVPLFSEANPVALYAAGMYGFAALTVSFLSLLLLFNVHLQGFLSFGLLTLTFFHVGLFIAQVKAPLPLDETGAPMALHGILAVLFLIFYWRER